MFQQNNSVAEEQYIYIHISITLNMTSEKRCHYIYFVEKEGIDYVCNERVF